jgi:hypothetical protein
MAVFIDSAILNEVEVARSLGWGWVRGVTAIYSPAQALVWVSYPLQKQDVYEAHSRNMAAKKDNDHG